jgi:hypothetical protein
MHQVVFPLSPKLLATSSVTPPILEVVVFHSVHYSSDWPYKYGSHSEIITRPAMT